MAPSTEKHNNPVAVVGCGPAGLSAAVALHDAGYTVMLFEKFDQPGPVGSGLMLQPTGLSVLDQLGLRSETELLGQRIDGMLGRVAPEGKVVLDINYKSVSADLYGLAIHRAALFDVLYNAVLKRNIPIQTSTEVVDVRYRDTNGQSRVMLMTADGGMIEHKFCLVIDASGSQSKLANDATQNTKRKTLEYGALWTTVKLEGTDFSRNLLEQRYKAASVMVGVLPCGKLPDNSAEHATLFWSLKSADCPALMDAGIDQWKQQVIKHWPAVQSLTDQLSDFNELTHARYAHHTMKVPYRKHIAFIGDAAHCTSPQLGQGVNMALLDTAALVAALNQTKPNSGRGRFNNNEVSAQEAALKLYASARRTHVRLFQAASFLLTPFYQSDSVVMPLLRDTLFEPTSKLPYADKLVTSLGAGLLAKPLQSIEKISRGLAETQ